MHLTFFMMLTMAIACIGLARVESSSQTDKAALNAVLSLVKGGSTPRYLKRTQKTTEGEDSAEEEERGWAEVAEKLKQAETEGKVEGQTAAASRWESLAAKVKEGQLKNLDTKQNKWQSAFTKLKASGQLKNVDEAEVVKVTDEVAQALKKDPKKWSKLKKALTITYGVALTALIVLGIEGMISK
ncbi:hypothetical protein PRNP1_011819 [Phytophthora ramorum]